jgi:hypothetical protein
MKNYLRTCSFIAATILLTACTPEVGSPEWCEMIDEKDKGDITVNEGKDYLKHCILKSRKQD